VEDDIDRVVFVNFDSEPFRNDDKGVKSAFDVDIQAQLRYMYIYTCECIYVYIYVYLYLYINTLPYKYIHI
jgi:hypothetical protein